MTTLQLQTLILKERELINKLLLVNKVILKVVQEDNTEELEELIKKQDLYQNEITTINHSIIMVIEENTHHTYSNDLIDNDKLWSKYLENTERLSVKISKQIKENKKKFQYEQKGKKCRESYLKNIPHPKKGK